MTSVAEDRRFGVNAGMAVKVPCAAASTAALVLSGEQTVDGVALVTGDRCLVKNQASSIDNGIYDVDTGAWSRSPDFDGIYDLTLGTLVKVNSGATMSGFWYVTSAGFPVPSTDAINFSMASATLAIVSAYMQTLLGSANQAAFLTASGFSAFFQTLISAADAGVMIDSMVANYTLAAIQSKLGITGPEYIYQRYGGL